MVACSKWHRRSASWRPTRKSSAFWCVFSHISCHSFIVSNLNTCSTQSASTLYLCRVRLAGKHFRRHNELRHNREGSNRRNPHARRPDESASSCAPRGHERARGPPPTQRERPAHHRRTRLRGRRQEGRRRAQLMRSILSVSSPELHSKFFRRSPSSPIRFWWELLHVAIASVFRCSLCTFGLLVPSPHAGSTCVQYCL